MKNISEETMKFSAVLLKKSPQLTPFQMDYWLTEQDKLQKALDHMLSIPDPRMAWRDVYYVDFDNKIKVKFSDIVIPKCRKDFGWLIVVPEGLTNQQLYNACKKSGIKMDDEVGSVLETVDSFQSVRTSEKSYALWVRDSDVPDEENKNKSVIDCEKAGIKGITLQERILLELSYRFNRSSSLDGGFGTICSGSRCDNGNYLGFRFRWDTLYIKEIPPGLRSEDFRVREVSL